MGCDIHAYIDEDIEDFTTCAAELYLSRDYVLFSLLAGVRRYVDDPDTLPVVAPRGLPPRVSYTVKAAAALVVSDEFADDMGHIATARAVQAREPRFLERWGPHVGLINDSVRVPNPDFHTPSWLEAGEIDMVCERYQRVHGGRARSLEAVSAMLYALDGSLPGRARMIFWFDN